MTTPIYLTTAQAMSRGGAQLRRIKRLHTLPPFTQPYAGILVDPYVIQVGKPLKDLGYGISSATFGYATAVVTGSGAPTAVSINTEATSRFLPLSQYMDAGNWWPIGGSASTYPRMTRPVSADPALDPSYSYRRNKTRFSAPAMTFNGAGYTHFYIAATPPINANFSLIYVLVPHHGVDGYWPLFDNETIGGNRIALRYSKGALQLHFGAGKVSTLETLLRPGEPMMVGLTANTVTNMCGLFVTDRKRSSRSHKIPPQQSLNGNGYLGIGYTGTAVDTTHFGDFDLLEFNYYNTSLTANKVEAIFTRLSSVYGVTK